MKIAIITGASSGMGKWFAAYAPAFDKTIDEIWLIGRNEERLNATYQHMKIKSRIIPMDLTKAEEYKKFQIALSKFRPVIRMLVNSAGYGIIGPFVDMTAKDAGGMVDINCEALTRITRDCIPFMSKDSCIINMSSAAAFMPQPDFAVYAATKSYVLSFSEALYHELKAKKIRVIAVCPGCVDTPFFDVAQKYHGVKTYKKFFMSKERDVVRQALLDVRKGKRVSIYGLPMKLLYAITRLIPNEILLWFM